ncbi:MAG: hypothetical protein Q4D38_07500 [Planctomycetia bacterium]|nr:hypothetical protein [Planctomycetia bacterium]
MFRAIATAVFVLAVCFVVSARAQVGMGSDILPPEPAPPGASSLAMDPYAPPGNTARPLWENPPSNPFGNFHGDDAAGTRLFQNFGVDLTWITPSSSPHNMGLFRMDFAGDIAFPLGAMPDRPILFEPRFAINYWNGPQSDEYDMAPQTFDASLGLRWLPQWQCPSFATIDFDLFFSVGIYSDFREVSSESFRFPSWGYVALNLTPNVRLKLGVWYLDRVRHKIFPSGGVIWTPNEQWEFQIMFPNPRVTYRPAGASLQDMTLYVRGEYGGGSWTVEHEYWNDCRTDYNDYRIMFGFDWSNRYRSTGFFELGVAFARELYFDDSTRPRRSYDLDAGFILQAGLHF